MHGRKVKTMTHKQQEIIEHIKSTERAAFEFWASATYYAERYKKCYDIEDLNMYNFSMGRSYLKYKIARELRERHF